MAEIRGHDRDADLLFPQLLIAGIQPGERDLQRIIIIRKLLGIGRITLTEVIADAGSHAAHRHRIHPQRGIGIIHIDIVKGISRIPWLRLVVFAIAKKRKVSQLIDQIDLLDPTVRDLIRIRFII